MLTETIQVSKLHAQAKAHEEMAKLIGMDEKEVLAIVDKLLSSGVNEEGEFQSSSVSFGSSEFSIL